MARKFRKQRRGKKRKWRQQKLAVGTVQKIARTIAKQEDQKHIRKYVHVTQVIDPLYLWHLHPTVIPSMTHWQTSTGTALYSKLLSDVGGNIQDASLTNLDGANQGKLELRIHGLQCFLAVSNNSDMPVRVEARIIFIPNANDYTLNTPNTYMRPRFTMFYKSGQGLNGLTYRGYDRRALAVADGTGIPIAFTTLARKVFNLPSRKMTGSLGAGGNSQVITLFKPRSYKKFSLQKYFKVPKKAFVRPDQDELANGNYFLVYWSDGSTVQQTYAVIASCNLQYSVKAPMKDDIGPGS